MALPFRISKPGLSGSHVLPAAAGIAVSDGTIAVSERLTPPQRLFLLLWKLLLTHKLCLLPLTAQ